jgi:dTDP-4-dehydrorhamnose reductase
MTLLILGYTGQVATALRFACYRQDRKAIAFGRPELDLNKPDHIFKILDAVEPTAVINAAAFTAVDLAEEKKAEAHQVNGVAPGLIAKALNERDIPFVHLSTDYVFDGNKKGPYVETDATNPINEYGKSKLVGEELVRKNYAKSFIFRVAWVYGPFGRSLWTTYLDKIKNHDNFLAVSDQTGTPTPSVHLAYALLSILDRANNGEIQPEDYGTYHAAGSDCLTRYDMGLEFKKACQSQNHALTGVVPVSNNAFPGRIAKRPKQTALNTDKLADRLNIRLPGVQEATTDFIKAHSHLKKFAEITSEQKDQAHDIVHITA